MTTIEVLPTDDYLNWGVFIQATLVGFAKSSCDADFAAWQMSKLYEEVKVLNYADQRGFMQKQIDEARKTVKNTVSKEKKLKQDFTTRSENQQVE